MNVLIITYDLSKPGRKYDALIAEIKRANSWAKLSESAWLIETSGSPISWRDKLKQIIDSNDKLTVLRIDCKGGWATSGASSQVNQWIQNHF